MSQSIEMFVLIRVNDMSNSGALKLELFLKKKNYGQWRSLVLQVINKLLLPSSDRTWYCSVTEFMIELGALCEPLWCMFFYGAD